MKTAPVAVPPFPRASRTILVLAALWVFTGGAYGCVLPFLTVYAAGRGLTLTGIGILGACSAAGSALLQPVVGRMVDRTGRRRTILVVSTGAGALGCAALGHARAPVLIGLCALLCLCGFYGSRVVITSSTVDHVARAGHGAAMYARFRTLPALGYTSTAVLGGLLLGRVTFAPIFTAGAVLYLLAGLSGLALPRFDSTAAAPAARGARSDAAIGPRRVLIVLALVSLLFYVVGSTSDTYVPLLMRALHGSYVDVGLVGTISTLLEVPVMILVGRLAERGWSAPLLVFGLLALPVRYALYTIVHAPVQLMAVQCLDAVSFSVYAIAGIDLLTNLTPPRERAWAVGVYAAAGTLGPILGPLLGSLLVGHMGIQSMLGMVTIVALSVPLLAAAGLAPLLIGLRAAPREKR